MDIMKEIRQSSSSKATAPSSPKVSFGDPFSSSSRQNGFPPKTRGNDGARLHAVVTVLLLAMALTIGCGQQHQFKSARKKKKKGKYYTAWEKYQAFAAAHSKSDLAPEALFRAGFIAQKQLGDCQAASTFFERVSNSYPQSDPWAKAASLQLNSCPDYFPLLEGNRWTEGDSDTEGKNARIEIVCEPIRMARKFLPSEAGILVKTYYAGERKSYESRYVYRKVSGELREFRSEDDPLSKTILKWPLNKGNDWRTIFDKRVFVYSVVDTNATVRVKAGEFSGCLKIKSSIEGIPGVATIEYFAPGVGRILTAVSTAGEEKRVTELLSYKMAEYPEFVIEEGQ